MLNGFMKGCLLGVGVSTLLGGGLLLLLQMNDLVSINLNQSPAAEGWINWIYGNLGYSVYLFLFLVIWFVYQMMLLNQDLYENAELLIVQVREQRMDLNITLVFGVGVIFTALGMRGALIHTLGGGAEAVDQSAAIVLGKLVDGGILVALSTTIVGGVSGYLMRLSKLLILGRKLSAYYHHEQEKQLRQLARYMADDINQNPGSP